MGPVVRGLVLLLILPLSQSARCADPAPIRVGIIGLDNYQAVDFTSQFHHAESPAELQGLRVVAAFAGGSPDIEESVQSLPRWLPAIRELGVEVVDTVAEVAGRCDAFLLMSLDGRTHLADFRAVAAAGKPVYVGRPMATSLADVLTMFRIADEMQVPLFSCSQHRFVPGFSGMRNHPEVGQIQGCSVWGGCPDDPLHPGTIWKSIHSVETLYTLMGPGCETVSLASTPGTDLTTGVWGDGRIGTVRGIRTGAVTFRAMVFGDKGISPSGDYGYGVPTNWVAPHGEYWGYKGVAIEIAQFFRTRQSPVSAAETIEIFTFMEAAHQSRARGGVPVRLDEVLAAARSELAVQNQKPSSRFLSER